MVRNKKETNTCASNFLDILQTECYVPRYGKQQTGVFIFQSINHTEKYRIKTLSPPNDKKRVKCTYLHWKQKQKMKRKEMKGWEWRRTTQITCCFLSKTIGVIHRVNPIWPKCFWNPMHRIKTWVSSTSFKFFPFARFPSWCGTLSCIRGRFFIFLLIVRLHWP